MAPEDTKAPPTYELIGLFVVRRYAEATQEGEKAKARGDVDGARYWCARQEALDDVMKMLAGGVDYVVRTSTARTKVLVYPQDFRR